VHTDNAGVRFPRRPSGLTNLQVAGGLACGAPVVYAAMYNILQRLMLAERVEL
jgi:hypothetical protein